MTKGLEEERANLRKIRQNFYGGGWISRSSRGLFAIALAFDETPPFHHDVAVSRCLMAAGIIENKTRAVFAAAK